MEEQRKYYEISPDAKECVCNNCTSFYKWGVHTGTCYLHSKKPIDHNESDYCDDFTKDENSNNQ